MDIRYLLCLESDVFIAIQALIQNLLHFNYVYNLRNSYYA